MRSIQPTNRGKSKLKKKEREGRRKEKQRRTATDTRAKPNELMRTAWTEKSGEDLNSFAQVQVYKYTNQAEE